MDRLRIHALVAGPDPEPGQPVFVLVHGLGMSSRYVLPVLRELARTHRVLAPDLPGYGRSDSPRRRWNLGELAGGLAAWLDATGIDRCVLVGNSLGVQVISTLAARHPHRPAAAVLIGPTGDPAVGGLFGQGLRLALDGLREPPGLLLVAVRDYGGRSSWHGRTVRRGVAGAGGTPADCAARTGPRGSRRA